MTETDPLRAVGRLTLPLRSHDEPGGPDENAAHPPRLLRLPRGTIDFAATVAVMGIVNVTPDSFYDRGATAATGTAVDHAHGLVAEGAHIVDVGGIKGGPGPEVTVADELARVVPFLERFRETDTTTFVSVDTFRAEVARAVLAAGADIVNDVTGGHDPEIFDVVAAHDAGYIAMHHGGEPRTRPFRVAYAPDVTTAVVAHLTALTERALEAGVRRDALVIDPGHDFQKTTYHSLELSRRLPALTALGFPVLVALSNKDFIGETLDAPLDRRVDGSLAAAVFSILRGANIVRVHEVARTVDAIRMTEALLGWRDPAVAVRGLE